MLPRLLPDGGLPFDLYRGSMTFDQVRDLMMVLGEDGRRLYRFVMVPLDMVLVVAYGAGVGCGSYGCAVSRTTGRTTALPMTIVAGSPRANASAPPSGSFSSSRPFSPSPSMPGRTC
ncbi:MAG: hypothetical protein QNJ43_16515 [Breoghania sp.]|nr:hypothetical protein [Breoghania sp.]